jgi:UTP--glucose-1-phosphate uridylyltransferase
MTSVASSCDNRRVTADLAEELSHLDPVLRAQLDACGFDPARLVRLARSLTDPNAASKRADANRVSGDVQPPDPGELRDLPPPGSAERSRLEELGRGALSRGEVAFCVMAGGMATRMGGVVKALVEALPQRTFLDLRLAENRTLEARAGRPVPLWLMTSEATERPIRRALAARGARAHVQTFRQDLSVRLRPDGSLFRDAAGRPSTYAPGHGDLPDALRRSGLLDAFRAQGGKIVWIANLDNLGATIDEVILGAFLESGAEVMVEVCDKVAGDRGGIPVHAEGRLQVLEEFRLPRGFDAAQVNVFSTNTLLVQADSLAAAPLAWTFFYVEKNVEGQTVVQFERLIQELTARLRAAYVRIPRSGAEARFLPVKDHDELARRRPEIEAVARARGMLD